MNPDRDGISKANQGRTKRPPRPPGRDIQHRNALQLVYAEAREHGLYEIGELFSHRGDDRWVDWNGEVLDRPRGRPQKFPCEAYLLYEMYVGAAKCSERVAESYLHDPDIWNPIREELTRRFPEYAALAPGQPGPTRNNYRHWKQRVANSPAAEAALLDRFSETACQLARRMGMFDPNHDGFTAPQLSDQLIGDGTVAKSMFNAVPGDLQFNELTGEWEQIRCDSDARRQHRRTEDEVTRSDVAGTHYGLIHGTTGHTNESIVVDIFHVPGGPGHSEANEAVPRIGTLVERLGGGVKGTMWDKAMRGKQIDQIYDMGILCHAKVSLAPGGTPKETLVEMATVRRNGTIVGPLPLVAVGGAPHIRVDDGVAQHHVALEIVRVGHRANPGGRGRPNRFFLDCKLPDDPRVPERFRGGNVRTRLDTTADDTSRNINRSENLRPVAEGQANWKVVGGQRSRAESMNSRVKHRWANGRLNAVGVPRQTLRLLGIAMAINRDAAMAHAERIKRPPGDPPPLRQAA